MQFAMEKSSANNEIEEWELLNEKGQHNCDDEYTHFNPTGLFDVNYFSSSPISNSVSAPSSQEQPIFAVKNCDEIEEAVEMIKHEVEPPVTVLGSDVIFDLVYDQMKENYPCETQKFSSEIEQVFDVNESLVTAYLQQNLTDIGLFGHNIKEIQKDCNDNVELKLNGNNNISTKFGSKWRSSGVRALYSLGLIAASMFILVLGGNQPKNQNKLSSTTNNETKVEYRGSKVTRANISFASCYNKPLM